MKRIKRLGLFSGGLGSWAAMKRDAENHGTKGTVLLFTDTKYEDEDLYRFLPEAAENVGAPLVSIADGRTIWEVMRDVRMLGNSMMDPCSKHLKREMRRKWMAEHCTPGYTTVVIGIGHAEKERFLGNPNKKTKGFKKIMEASGYACDAPLLETPHLSHDDILQWCQREGMDPPRLYDLGMPHNNCKGGCVKAGMGQWRHLLRVLPEVYAEWEREEQKMRDFLGQNVSIMRDRRGGKTIPLTLVDFRKRVEAGEKCDLLKWASCGCFTGEEDE